MTSELQLRPYQGAGDIDFGMTPDDLSRLLGPPTNDRRGGPPGSAPHEMYWQEARIQAYFDDDDTLCFIDFYPGAVLIAAGIPLRGSYRSLCDALEHSGYPATEPTLSGEPIWQAVFYDLGAIISRGEEDENSPAEITSAFRRGLLDGHYDAP